MKIIIQNDGTNDITVINNECPNRQPWEVRYCSECRFFHHHYNDHGNGIFTKKENGHCYPPKPYSHRKEHMVSDNACCWFKPII